MFTCRPICLALLILGFLAPAAHGQSRNLLDLTPAAEGATAQSNFLTVTITGDRNGGVGAFSPQIAGILTPGLLSQDGVGNALSVTVIGDDNVFAAAQTGAGNQAAIAITGVSNQALVSQTGIGNIATITQVGAGNIIAIRQRGR